VSAIAGVMCVAKEGDVVEAGQPILELHLDDPSKLPFALVALEGAIEVADEPPVVRPLVLDVIRA